MFTALGFQNKDSSVSPSEECTGSGHLQGNHSVQELTGPWKAVESGSGRLGCGSGAKCKVGPCFIA